MIVITLFKKGKKQDSKIVSVEKKNTDIDKTNESEKILKELDKRLKRIEQLLENLSKKPIEYNFNIEKLDINNPIIKDMSFGLDRLDIKELSGSLNLGNNFGVTVDKDSKEKEKQKKKKDSVTIKFDKKYKQSD